MTQNEQPIFEKMSGGDLVITRSFNAPRELVWKTWTEPERVKRWWGPRYFSAPVCKIDFRVGGKFLFCMRGPNGKDHWNTGTYREIIPQERLDMTNFFADEKGNVVPPAYYGQPGEWGKELALTLTLEDLGGKTRMTLRCAGLPEGLAREQAETGWNQSLDKFDAALAKA